MSTRMAEKFLQEIRGKPGLMHRFTLIENFVLLHSNNRGDIEKARMHIRLYICHIRCSMQALRNFSDMCKENLASIEHDDAPPVGNVGAWLGMARAHLLLKQQPRAKQILKVRQATTGLVDRMLSSAHCRWTPAMDD